MNRIEFAYSLKSIDKIFNCAIVGFYKIVNEARMLGVSAPMYVRAFYYETSLISFLLRSL